MKYQNSTPFEEGLEQAQQSVEAPEENNQTETMFETLLKTLGLQAFYPQKMELTDVIKIRNYSHFEKYSSLPWIFLRNIMLTNFNARDILIETQLEQIHESCLETNDVIDINPIDLMLLIFKCCSDELRQVLVRKLFLCRLAIPFSLPCKLSEPLILGVWSILPLVFEQKLEKGSKQMSAIECPCHVVSFVRLGELLISKSKLINQVLSDQYNDTFFNNDCALGTNTRFISDGMIEAAWCLPTKRSSEVTLYLNLRGDGLCLDRQLKALVQISSAIVVMLDIKQFEDENCSRVLSDIHKRNSGMVLAVDARCYKIDKEAQNVCLQYWRTISQDECENRIITLAVNKRPKSIFIIKKELALGMSRILSRSPLTALAERLKSGNGVLYNVDDEITKFKKAKQRALNLVRRISSNPETSKDDIVPLQGKLWQDYSEHLKHLKQSTRIQTIETIEKTKSEMEKRRQNQLYQYRKTDSLIKMFLCYILEDGQTDNEHILFISYLRLFLDERSRQILPTYLSIYQEAWQGLKAAKNKQDANIKLLEKELIRAEHNLADASLGFEHLMRECGQVYEAIMECKRERTNHEKNLALSLSKVCAKLLLLGQPFELMDGDAANVPMVWVKAVLRQLKELIGNKKMLSLSVLGIQSSGKSTLLNTMFGLQFAVSAGRCTRGVYCQLIPVDEKMSKFDYILVVDTEGLRASELEHEKHDHDNKLATFVIGLGDITIINIKGENTSEIKDTLQIAVHAFLRLKLVNVNLNLRQSCVFVHQNVPAMDASDKMTHGRKKFVEKLDEMTKEAAAQERITNIQSFDQVIEFDSEKDVWYFSDLWVGDPPMAPTNPGYSENANDVKNSVISKLVNSRNTFLNITDTITRIVDLWNGILTDDFVFGFKNTLEVKAYSNMEKFIQDINCRMRKYFSTFSLCTAKTKLESCKDEGELQTKMGEIRFQLIEETGPMVSQSKKDIEAFVEKSDLKDVMNQWVETHKMQLQTLSQHLLALTEKNILKFKEEKRIMLMQITEKTRHENEINERARQIAQDLEGKHPSIKQIADKFENMWDEWMLDFSSTQIKDDDVSVIHLDIEKHIKTTCSEIGSYLSKHHKKHKYQNIQHLKRSLNKEDFVEKVHFQLHRTINLLKIIGNFRQEEQKEEILQKTILIFGKIDTKLKQITSEDNPYNEGFILDVLRIIIDDFDDFNDHQAKEMRFDLLPPYKAFLIQHIRPYVTTVFQTHAKEYNRRHSLKSQLENYKITAWELFQNLVNQKTEEFIAAGLFRNALEAKVESRVLELIPQDIKDLLYSEGYKTKYGIIKQVMKHLADTDKFCECYGYIQDPSGYVQHWLTDRMNEIVFKSHGNGSNTYAHMAGENTSKIISVIQKSIKTATQKCREENKMTCISWVEEFNKNIFSSNLLPMSLHTFDNLTRITIKDIMNFEELVLAHVKEMKVRICYSINSQKARWKENPTTTMMSEIWGCKEKCPFCYEPCMHTDKNHLEFGRKHECLQHKIKGLRGITWVKTDKLTLNFCNIDVQNDVVSFRDAEGEEWTKYEDYQSKHPNWFIAPNPDTSEYWMWLLCKHKKSFEKAYDKTFDDIPPRWTKIDKDEATNFLK